MILIGQYDSPFVRRVGIALRLYGFAFEHLPWSAFSDADRLAAHNPLRRVPTLVLDDGSALIESAGILDYLDEARGRDRALIAAAGPARHRDLRRIALATGLADKAVALFYERVMHEVPAPAWTARLEGQVAGTLAALEAERAGQDGFWFGASPGHADIALGCVLHFLDAAHPGLFVRGRHPALAAHADACEALAVFAEIRQPFIAPR
ncbi:glutathione S-transferase family protein [Zavarzinia compransoris]|uniref:Glutathione S-transferase n=1 Tax=Zavarzinia compransoris TaxID=1264899 RepID=A0A317E8X5_9PROT|nr:glutathione S-transferase family protein [Zavarzinia compransoris]PWR23032.1 glutathione S-transferase [Zavarzinia compransoris]TDP46423.1 glutathione S-transferase [Zavarzinia compransoris]